MSADGTAYNEAWNGPLTPLVAATIAEGRRLDFPLCVRPEIGRLHAVLAGGLPPGSLVGESGTGVGTSLAWMVSTADPSVRFISYEIDETRAEAAQRLLADHPNVEIVCGDGRELFARGPFDLLLFDGGPGSGKGSPDDRVDPTTVLTPGGTMTVDDYTPTTTWPPMFDDAIDAGRHAILTDPNLHATEIRVAPDLAVLVARHLPET